jgi:CBS domain-containing protein
MKEFVDFLGAHPPYDALDGSDLQRLARQIEVEYFPAGTVVVAADSPPLTHIHVVRTGAIEIVDRGRVVDLLVEGDTFGHVSVLSGLPPPLVARASEDTVAYQLPDPRTVLANPERLRFTHYGSLVARERLTRTTLLEAARRPVGRYLRPGLWADPTTTIQEAARLVDEAGQSCLIVDTGFGLGMVTDHDFRRFVAGGTGRADAPVAEIASGPLLTVAAETTVSAAFLEMVEHGVHHLVVTGDGDRPVGIVRVVDLASTEVRDPFAGAGGGRQRDDRAGAGTGDLAAAGDRSRAG